MPARRTRSRIYTSRDGVIGPALQVTDDAMTTDASPTPNATVIQMKVQLAGMNEKLTDHEARIRGLEAAKAKLVGAFLLITLAVGASGWLAVVATHH